MNITLANAATLHIILCAEGDHFLVVNLVVVVSSICDSRLCVWRILEHSLECSSVHFLNYLGLVEVSDFVFGRRVLRVFRDSSAV